MADKKQLAILKQGPSAWNQWRAKNPKRQIDLRNADLVEAELGLLSVAEDKVAHFNGTNLSKADLDGADLRGADLTMADLSKACLSGADLSSADLSFADLTQANLSGTMLFHARLSQADLSRANLFMAELDWANLHSANLIGAHLCQASLAYANLDRARLNQARGYSVNLEGANLRDTDLSSAVLTKANFSGAHLVNTNLDLANLTSCSIYGISAWGLKLRGAIQSDLIITPDGEPMITVDNLEMAQFIYILLNNEKMRDVINTMTTKIVLILGRFTKNRKRVLDAIREELRHRNYLPVLFDFTKPATRDYTETVSTLAHLARFIIADLTDPSSIPQELEAIIPKLAVPVQPILLASKHEWSLFVDFSKKFPWVLPIHYYKDTSDLLTSLETKVIAPAEAKAKELEKR